MNKNNDNNFSEQVDKVIKGIYPERDMLIVSKNTPKIMQEIGLNNLPITMTQKHLKTIMNNNGEYKNSNYHDLGIELVKQLPASLSEPLNILQSSTKGDSIVIITDLVDKQDKTIIAIIKKDGTGRINDAFIDSNVLTSAYGRNNYDKFMQDNIAKGNMLYDIDEGIIKRSGGKLQLQPFTSINKNISQINNNVKSDISNNYDMLVKNNYTIINDKELKEIKGEGYGSNLISYILKYNY